MIRVSRGQGGRGRERKEKEAEKVMQENRRSRKRKMKKDIVEGGISIIKKNKGMRIVPGKETEGERGRQDNVRKLKILKGRRKTMSKRERNRRQKLYAWVAGGWLCVLPSHHHRSLPEASPRLHP